MKLPLRWCALALAAHSPALQLGAQQHPVRPSPPFNAERLAALPGEEWITNGGNLATQRYSPLEQINRDNVAGLRAAWRASLGGSGITPRGSNQAEPLYFDGTVYVVTSVNDVFAIDVESGAIAWTYRGNVDAETAQPCCGWAVRGLAMGDGKIFLGKLDAKLVALDQTSGDELWSVEVADPNARYSITSAPRYYAGMVITDTSGGAISGGSTPDLRRMSRATHAEFAAIVLGGLRADRGMVSFADIVSADDAAAVQGYLIKRAREDWASPPLQ